MGEPDIAALFGHLAREMSSMSSALSAHGVSQIVPKFWGDPKKFREWIKAIEKYAQLCDIADDKKKMVAFQASGGPVSGYISRFIQAQRRASWDELKEELTKRFSDVSDKHHAMSVLRNIKQKSGENIQLFAERLLSLAEEAFDNIGGPEIERQLIDIFVDGLYDERLKLRILRVKPDTLQGAISLVTEEQNLRRRVGLADHDSARLGDPSEMEIDHSRPMHCFNCHKLGHTAKKFRQAKRKTQVNLVAPSQNAKQQEFRCYACGRLGHIARYCRKPQPPRMSGPGVANRETNDRNMKNVAINLEN